MYWRQFLHIIDSVAIICNLDFVRLAIVPAETDAPLVVDADRELAGSISTQLLQAVAGRSKQVAEVFRFVQIKQLAPRGFLNSRRELPGLASFENVSGFIAGKTLDHC